MLTENRRIVCASSYKTNDRHTIEYVVKWLACSLAREPEGCRNGGVDPEAARHPVCRPFDERTPTGRKCRSVRFCRTPVRRKGGDDGAPDRGGDPADSSDVGNPLSRIRLPRRFAADYRGGSRAEARRG